MSDDCRWDLRVCGALILTDGRQPRPCGARRNESELANTHCPARATLAEFHQIFNETGLVGVRPSRRQHNGVSKPFGISLSGRARPPSHVDPELPPSHLMYFLVAYLRVHSFEERKPDFLRTRDLHITQGQSAEPGPLSCSENNQQSGLPPVAWQPCHWPGGPPSPLSQSPTR